MQPSSYNIRVYGIWKNDRNEVLLTDERRGGYEMTKFPGGGHEFGEGLADGLIREWKEELDIEVEVGKLIYINEFLQISAFNPQDQLLSVYYEIFADHAASFPLARRPLDFPPGQEDAQLFRWQAIESMTPDMFTFPVDKVVSGILRQG